MTSTMCRRLPAEYSAICFGGGVVEHSPRVRRIARRRRVCLFGLFVQVGTLVAQHPGVHVAGLTLHHPRQIAPPGCYDEQPATEGLAPSPAEPYNLPLMLPQYLTENVLRVRLAEPGHAPRFGHELTGFGQDGEGVTARLATADGTTATVRARYLVGADGGRSFVRKALAIDFPGESMKMRAMVADLSLTGLGRDAWHRWGEGPGQISLCPLMGTDLFQLQMPVPLDGDIDTSDAALAAVIAARTGRADIAVHAVHWRSVYEMSSRLADRYRVGRVFIAGDAAHIHPPTGGQGLNTSVQDAWNLGWKLAAVVGGAPDALLDTYETERREVAAGMLGLSSKLLEAARTRGDPRRGRETQQLDLGYRTSPLSHDARGTTPSCAPATARRTRRVAERPDRLYVYLRCWVTGCGPCCAMSRRPAPGRSRRARG
jgi:2-polyprenyl-6-methoxyphenol hydroxylase-like FAD-dependent oxidoreductase